MIPKSVSILGSTGSIGRQTLDVCRRLKIYPAALAAGRNLDLLVQQIEDYQPRLVSVSDSSLARKLQTKLQEHRITPPEIMYGQGGLCACAGIDSDCVVGAVSGFNGLPGVLEAIRSGHRVALANKETLVAAGDLVMKEAQSFGVSVYPVDSEHSAVWQCLKGWENRDWKKLWLTASGGPFRTFSQSQLQLATPEQALKHPVWNMGSKVTIDSATLMNKGLEIIEAMHLFQASVDQIGVVIHPESIIHSLVEFQDGALLAQMGNPDMRIPIQMALTWPDRVASGLESFNFFSPAHASLHFEEPDLQRFPCLRLALQAARAGGALPLVLNAADQVATEAYLDHRLTFYGLSDLVERCLDYFSDFPCGRLATLEEILDLNERVTSWCRQHLRNTIE